ncbi:MAG TPA: relaxase/mobilization nuclease domain-containing protein, partial [Longimicrobium sp.]|nr:relaxase/mobilization nuclease domain-containing protein [Longimicrobium sp.]
MIGRIFPGGKSFKKLISYLSSGKGGRRPDRVAWTEFYNLPTRKPRVAACYMAATGRSSISCTPTPVYHFSVSFAPDDPVDEAMMRRVAERTLRDMGLAEYECAVFAHRDRSHLHLHFVVCRVHPERRTLFRNWRDRTRLEHSMRAQEVDLGLQVVPGWLAPVPAAMDRARDRLAQGREPEARWLKPRPGPRRGDSTFLQDVTERAAPVLAEARSWAELERGLAEQGLSLRVKGGGFRITDGKHQVKASEVGRGFSRYHLEQRLGGYPDYRARMAVAGIAPARPSPTAVQASASPEPAAEPTPQASAHALPVETRALVQPDAPSVELPRPPSPGRQKVNFLMEAKERAAPVLQRADSWEVLERDLAAHGFSLQVRGGGFVVARGELEVKA